MNDYNNNEKNIDLDAAKQMGDVCIDDQQCTLTASNSECYNDYCQCTTDYQGDTCDDCMYLYLSAYLHTNAVYTLHNDPPSFAKS